MLAIKKAAVIGKPIAHSLSPAIFTFLAQRAWEQNPSLEAPPLHYSAIQIDAAGKKGGEGSTDPEDLETFLAKFKDGPNWIGLNVTIPYKEKVFKFLKHLSPEAQATGAVNLIHKSAAGLTGYNTDIIGILMTLKNHAPPLKGQRACVFGAGGAARAVLYALGELKLGQVDLIARNSEQALGILARVQEFFPETLWTCPLENSEAGNRPGPPRGRSPELTAAWAIEDRKPSEVCRDIPHSDKKSPHNPSPTPVALCINTTPLGMSSTKGSVHLDQNSETHSALPEDLSFFESVFQKIRPLNSPSLAFDLIYRPENTPFLKIAESHGFLPIGGLEMLVEQALAAWKIWMGPSPSITSELLHYLRNRPLFLTGIMGAGKSTVGEILARRLARKFVDLDRVIESTENKSIAQIFQEKGEAEFRAIEWREFQKQAIQPGIVLALGGGTLVNALARELVQKAGTLIYLKARPQTLAERLQKEQPHARPLLQGFEPSGTQVSSPLLERIQTLLQEREAFYLQAHLHVETDEQEAEQTADFIFKIIKN